MIKKTGKNKKAGKKPAKKQSAEKTENKKELNLAEVRQNIKAMIETEAQELAKGVIAEGKKGQLPTVKYLFEMAHIHPELTEPTTSSEKEDSLAETLLGNLKIPLSPVIHEMYEKGEDVVIIPPRADVEDVEEKKEEQLVGVE